MSCAQGDARVLEVAREYSVETAAASEIQVFQDAPDGARMVIVRGPVLGSMDMPDIKTELACSALGIVFTETVLRSADFHGAAAKNVLWRPIIRIAVVLRAATMMLEIRWNMYLTNGKEVDKDHSRAGERYPVIVTKTIE